MRRLFVTALITLLGIAACSQDDGKAPTPRLATGYWHATITLPGGDIEAGIELSHRQGLYVASLVNGQERVPIDQVRLQDDELLLRFPAYNNEIRARLVGGELRGELVLTKRFGATQSMPFRAVPGAGRGDAQPGSGEVDLSGRWAVTFDEPDGSQSPAIGEFSQRGSRLFGTFLNPNGDYRYLAGHVKGSEFKLSTFDGAHAFVFKGRVVGDRIEDGGFWSGTEWFQEWSGVRNPNASLPDAYTRTYLNPGFDRFEFEFPDIDGTPVSIDDPRFAGKVVVVTLAGTWCPNCHDEARFMAPLYAKYRERGLEIVALMYEHFDDRDLATEQVRHFREKFGIEYTTLIAGISSKTDAAETLPSLNAVLAFPTTIFIDRSGRVRRIHTGFNGPGTGEHYKKLTGEITTLIDQLLNEPAGTLAGNAPSGQPT